LRLEVTTGLDSEQLTELVVGVRARLGGEYVSRGRPFALGLFRSVAMVLLRQNIVQQLAAEMFGVSQSTVSRRWDALREVIEAVLTEFVPTPAQVAGTSTVLVDGTLIPTWDWRHRSDLFSGKHHDTGFNLQIGATLSGNLVAVGAPVPGARHDAHAWQASGLADLLANLDHLADLGYVGVGQILTGHKKTTRRRADRQPKQVNTDLGHPRRRRTRHRTLKNWKVLSGRYRGPLDKLPSVIRTVVTLAFFKAYF
jgi:DDE superfamily endonuclease/Helix-turn-helix of DDE superfamily endonuclease